MREFRDGQIVDVPDEVMATDPRRPLTAAVQRRLDQAAADCGYDGILSACSYDGDADPVFAAEAASFKAWRSVVWRYCYGVLDAVQSGARGVPSVAELLAELPERVI